MSTMSQARTGGANKKARHSKSTATVSLHSLSDDILLTVADTLPSLSDRAHLASTCRRFRREVLGDDSLLLPSHQHVLSADLPPFAPPPTLATVRTWHTSLAPLANTAGTQLEQTTEVALPAGCDSLAILDAKTLVAFESGWGWWAWDENEQPISRCIVLVNIGSRVTARTVPLHIPADAMGAQEPLFAVFGDGNRLLVLFSTEKRFIFGVRPTEAGSYAFEYKGAQRYADGQSAADKDDLHWAIPRKSKSKCHFGFTFETTIFSESNERSSTRSQMEVRKDDRLHSQYPLHRLHINHFPYAWDAKLMLCGDSSGEDAFYSLQLVDWRTGERLRGGMRIPTRSGFIRNDWSSLWLHGTLFYIESGGNFVSDQHRKAPCTLYALRAEGSTSC